LWRSCDGLRWERRRLAGSARLGRRDLAIVTYGASVAEARKAAAAAIEVNLEAYREAGQGVPERQSVTTHLENPDFRDLLFTYMQVSDSRTRIAA
jgi:HicB_like antitoxin of bacterial toxin-antitoxin system